MLLALRKEEETGDQHTRLPAAMRCSLVLDLSGFPGSIRFFSLSVGLIWGGGGTDGGEGHAGVRIGAPTDRGRDPRHPNRTVTAVTTAHTLVILR